MRLLSQNDVLYVSYSRSEIYLMKLQGLMKHFIELMRCVERFRTEREYKDVFRCENSVFFVSDQRHQVPEIFYNSTPSINYTL